MKKKLVFSAMLVCLLAWGLTLIGCSTGSDDDDAGDDPNTSFVAVTSISGIPGGGVKNTPITLTGTVSPATATNKTIAWTVKTAGTTGATITDGNELNTTAAGTVVVTATIVNGLTESSNYTQDFTITITDTFVAVTSITDVPADGTSGTPLTLTGTVNPSTATNKTIVWTVKTPGTTGATIADGNKLNTTAAGTVTVTATIVNGLTASSNYTQDFNITITGGGGGSFIPVTSITDVPNSGGVGTAFPLSGTVNPSNATNQTIVWSVLLSNGTGATINENTFKATSSGTPRVRATIVNGLTESSDYTQDFIFMITVGGSVGIDNWSTLLGKWKGESGEDLVQLEFKPGLSMGGYSFSVGYSIDGYGAGGGSVFACSYVGTTLRKYDAETHTTEETFTVIVSGDGQTLTFSDYQYHAGDDHRSYMNSKTYTKQP
ncbi:MAG: hypothetical protein LBK13_09030 [Spirochaetales bacterium]|jgi:hypothetical protein|nr:hypothetical protein [Spirochaetales bacterium]